jgi:hypothetical protein
MTLSSPTEKRPTLGLLLINQEIQILMLKTGIEQQRACHMRSNHPVPHLMQSAILPNQTMRNKRFADRIAPISTRF